MNKDYHYKPGNVAAPYQKTFEQLKASFPAYALWQRRDNFGRWLSAAVINPATQVASTIVLIAEGLERTPLLTHHDLETIRRHLESEACEDLSL